VEAISPRTAVVAAAVVLACACLVGLVAAALPAANATPTSSDATLTTAVTAGNATAATANATSVSTTTVATPVRTAAPNATVAPLTLALTLARSPALWGDTVRVSGSGAGNTTVTILVDGAVAGTAVTGPNGTYRFDYFVDRLPAGTHAVRAETGALRMAEAPLEVAAVDSVVLLAVAPSEMENQTALQCTGNVTAASRPVPGAAVRLVFDGTGTADCITGPAGQFELLAGVAGGSHEVVANVSFADGRPINPGSSGAVRAEVPGGFSVLPLLGVLLLLLVGAGGFLFWRRSRGDDGGAVPAPVLARPVLAPQPAPVAEAPSPVEDLRATALEFAGDGGRDGIEAVYRALVERFAAREPGAHLGSMTPRELAAHFAGTPVGIAVARVAACYEAVVYSGRAPTPVDVETVVEGFVAALAETARAGQ
jgi:hypothetical protein